MSILRGHSSACTNVCVRHEDQSLQVSFSGSIGYKGSCSLSWNLLLRSFSPNPRRRSFPGVSSGDGVRPRGGRGGGVML